MIKLVQFDYAEAVLDMMGVHFVNGPLQSPIPKARSSSITWELVKNADSWISFQTNESENLHVGCSYPDLSKPLMLMPTHVEKQWYKERAKDMPLGKICRKPGAFINLILSIWINPGLFLCLK